MIGWGQSLLVVLLFINPEAQEDEIAMFIYENSRGNVYSWSVVKGHDCKMKRTSKKASTDAYYQAFTPKDFLQEELFPMRSLPLGIFKLPWRILVDFDVCVDSLACTKNYSKGHGMVGLETLHKPVHHTRDTKLVVASLCCGTTCNLT